MSFVFTLNFIQVKDHWHQMSHITNHNKHFKLPGAGRGTPKLT